MLLSLSLVVVVLLPASIPAQAGEVPAPGDDDGMGLLRRAAESVREVSFEGVQRVTAQGRGAGGTGSRLVEVVHRAGEATGYRYAGGAQPAEGLVVGQTPLLMKVDELLLDRLAANYRVTRVGEARVCGRSTDVLEVRRADGTAAGRLWIDKRTGLPLRKWVRGPSGRLVHAGEFVEFRVRRDPGPLPEHRVRARPWSDELSGAELARLRERGWHIPEQPAWDLRLIRAWAKQAEGGRIVHLAYSDGLSVVSVFVQRGRLADESEGTGTGAAKVVQGDGAAAAGQRLMWDSEGFVYTAMGQAPPGLLAAAVAGFPTAERPDFWERVLRGVEHLTAAATG
ncbi:sigma-E factor regulatory protein RseB domain-containing protein [Streptomonospora litoralis]|uniref:sigma-E factor regulatory protein RseB domain-containing protein n=1 Tax=Streptomonospora litoralis TaxID=2498135 RepID=UPI0013F16B89|nr:sigma-E factor regulatory protein RseB domain-containing protein [Streptomonospora litoralis]